MTEVLPDVVNAPFDGIGFYGRITPEQTEQEFEQYSEPLKQGVAIVPAVVAVHVVTEGANDVITETQDFQRVDHESIDAGRRCDLGHCSGDVPGLELAPGG